jgi:hypothetical protein
MADCSRVASTQSAVFGTKKTSAAADKLQHGRILSTGPGRRHPGNLRSSTPTGKARHRYECRLPATVFNAVQCLERGPGTFGNRCRFPAHHVLMEENPMKKLLISTALAAFAVTSAFAQTTSEFYVVRDATTKKCTIVDKKPTTTSTTVVDNGIFKTRTEAETGMKTMKVCTEN